MDNRGVSTVLLLLASACSTAPQLSVRAQKSALAEGQHPASFRVAEAQGYFALGSIGLAAEGFRRALREDPASVDALNGLAACYDKMGRFDLSRSYYEKALALAPTDARVFANLAASLSQQGKLTEAGKVRAELADLGATSMASVALPAVPPVVSEAASASVATAAVSVPLEQPIALALADAPELTVDGPRIERLSLGEVMLVTSRPARAAYVVLKADAPGVHAPRARMASGSSVTILNAARVERLAANTRVRLQQLGWRQVSIGNAPRMLAVSRITYPQHRTAEAQRIARQLGIDLRVANVRKDEKLIVQLGRDMARRRTPA